MSDEVNTTGILDKSPIDGTLSDLAISEKIANGEINTIIATDGHLLVPMRITGTGITKRNYVDKTGKQVEFFIDRPKEDFLSDRFLQCCNGLPVCFFHATDGLTYDNWKDYIVGDIFYPYIKGDQVWGVAKIWDISMLDAFKDGYDSTSPFVTSKNTLGEDNILRESFEDIDHVAIVEAGHWDNGEPAITQDTILTKEDLMDETKKPEPKIDDASNIAQLNPDQKKDAEPAVPAVADPTAVPAEQQENAKITALEAKVDKLISIVEALVQSDKAVHAEVKPEATPAVEDKKDVIAPVATGEETPELSGDDEEEKGELVNAVSEMVDSAHTEVKIKKPADKPNLSSSEYLRRVLSYNKEYVDPKYHCLFQKIDSANKKLALDALDDMKKKVAAKSVGLYTSAKADGTYIPTGKGTFTRMNF
jgi:hypothetical protein